MPNARAIASGLLLFTGVAHLAYYFAGPGAAQGPGMAVFGVIYFVLGLALRRPGRWPLWLAVLLPAIGGLGGSSQMLQQGFGVVMAIFVAIDVVVVACAIRLIAARQPA